ncbi:MAG: metal ABC transporter substrate-binding protein [Lachnospiraceae bacterium]|nr:metal ABC transporter substrate-binding protein [Lachnospiraceae bacterium]
MKKILILFIITALAAGMCNGCAEISRTEAGQKDRLLIVTTIFPEYDWVREILGDKKDNADVKMLLDNGVDLHSYQPTADDILAIAGCDMFIYVGGESDGWVEDALKEAENKNMVVINLLESLGDSVKAEEIVEGMEHDHDHDHEDEDHDHDHEDEDHDHDHEDEDHDHEKELDEHVWLSLKNAAELCSIITDGLAKLDPDNASSYRSNCETYVKKLDSLDSQYSNVVENAKNKTLLFGDRFPFRYLTDDYGLSYYAAFAGCSAETEASFETIVFLSGKVDELGLKSIMTIESSDKKIANTIRENTKTKDQKILTLDSMQSTTSKDVASGTTYISIMESNLEVLKESIGK